MANQDEKYSQLTRNIDIMTQMAFDAFENGSTCVPQFLFDKGKPNGFRREERFEASHLGENEPIGNLKKLLKSGYGHIKVMVKENKVVLFIAEETIKAVP